MKDIEQRWIQLPQAEVDYRQMLTVDGRIVDISDITSQMLSDYIELARISIDESLQQQRESRRFETHSSLRPAILIGRLAVIKNEFHAFTNEAQMKSTTDQLEKVDLQPRYRDFWRSIEQAHYVPEIHRSIMSNDSVFAGSWLAAHRA